MSDQRGFDTNVHSDKSLMVDDTPNAPKTTIQDGLADGDGGDVHVQMTSAKVTIHNGLSMNKALIVETKALHLDPSFPSQRIRPLGVASAQVYASDVPYQSTLYLHIEGEEQRSWGVRVDVDIGRGLFSTAARPKYFKQEEGWIGGAVVLAPINPLRVGNLDFDIHVFYGHQKLRACLASFIDANLPAVVYYIQKRRPTIPTGLSVVPEIKIEDFLLSDVSCKHGAVGRWSGEKPNIWRLDAVFAIENLKLWCSALIDGHRSDLKAMLQGVCIWVELEIDVTLTAKPAVSDFRISFDNYGVDGELLDLLKKLPKVGWFFELLLDHLASSYLVAAYLNTDLKDTILQAINKTIPAIKPSGTLSASFVQMMHDLFVGQDEQADPDFGNQPPEDEAVLISSDEKYKSWMSTPAIQTRKLRDLKLPGTHDSATQYLSGTLSQISYKDIEFLWGLASSNAPVDATWPFPKKMSAATPFHLGSFMYYYMIGEVAWGVAVTHTLTILEQLRLGIRHFDIRIYFDTRDNQLHVYHGNRGMAFSVVLKFIKHFLDENATASELIFVAIRGANFQAFPQGIAAVTSLIESTIQPSHRYQPELPGQLFDFQTLADTTVGSITNGASKVMFLNGSVNDYLYPTTVTNSTGYAGVEYTGDAYTFEDLLKREGDGIAKNTKPLWSVGWVLGATNQQIVEFAIRLFLQPEEGRARLLKSIAAQANIRLPELFEQVAGSFNLVTVDFPEYGSSKHGTFMDFIMKLNQGAK